MISENNSKNNEYLDKLHHDILCIMDEIHRICIKYNIQYYLIGGTLLGAIRHKGFIPWDDDLDIAMPRNDMNRFFEVIKTEMNESFYLQWITTDSLHANIFAKICMKETEFIEHEERKIIGIFVDIFPLDKCDGYSKMLNFRRTIIRKLNLISLSKWSKKMSFKKLISFVLPNKTIFKLQEKLMETKDSVKGEYYANFGSQYPLYKQTMPLEWYATGILMPFEGRSYIAPVEYTKVLESIFGPHYMELPPINKRRSHYPLKVKFSDGSVMEFKKTKKRITVFDQ